MHQRRNIYRLAGCHRFVGRDPDQDRPGAVHIIGGQSQRVFFDALENMSQQQDIASAVIGIGGDFRIIDHIRLAPMRLENDLRQQFRTLDFQRMRAGELDLDILAVGAG